MTFVQHQLKRLFRAIHLHGLSLRIHQPPGILQAVALRLNMQRNALTHCSAGMCRLRKQLQRNVFANRHSISLHRLTKKVRNHTIQPASVTQLIHFHGVYRRCFIALAEFLRTSISKPPGVGHIRARRLHRNRKCFTLQRACILRLSDNLQRRHHINSRRLGTRHMLEGICYNAVYLTAMMRRIHDKGIGIGHVACRAALKHIRSLGSIPPLVLQPFALYGNRNGCYFPFRHRNGLRLLCNHKNGCHSRRHTARKQAHTQHGSQYISIHILHFHSLPKTHRRCTVILVTL